jgi:SNW domain-containing protein 1
MATLAKAEKAELMTQSLKEKRDDSEESDSRVGTKRTYEVAYREREALKADRRRDIVREDRMERAGIKKSKTERDNDRDISEKIALGQAQPSSRETMFD